MGEDGTTGSASRFKFSRYALEEIALVGIPKEVVEGVLLGPEQIVDEIENLQAYQSKVDFGGGKEYLLRVIVNDGVDPAVVVTVYRTKKIEKYWRES